MFVIINSRLSQLDHLVTARTSDSMFLCIDFVRITNCFYDYDYNTNKQYCSSAVLCKNILSEKISARSYLSPWLSLTRFCNSFPLYRTEPSHGTKVISPLLLIISACRATIPGPCITMAEPSLPMDKVPVYHNSLNQHLESSGNYMGITYNSNAKQQQSWQRRQKQQQNFYGPFSRYTWVSQCSHKERLNVTTSYWNNQEPDVLPATEPVMSKHYRKPSGLVVFCFIGMVSGLHVYPAKHWR